MIVKGCPFCECSTVILESEAVRCIECNARVPGENQINAVEKWNRRVVIKRGPAYNSGRLAFSEFDRSHNYEYFSGLTDQEIAEWIEGYRSAHKDANGKDVRVSFVSEEVGCFRLIIDTKVITFLK